MLMVIVSAGSLASKTYQHQHDACTKMRGSESLVGLSIDRVTT